MRLNRVLFQLIALPSVITPMSFAPASTFGSTGIQSEIVKGGKVNARSQLATSYLDDDPISITELSVGKKQTLADFTVNYEIYKMEKSTLLYMDYVPLYSLVYKIDVHLYANVSYKGGFADLFTYTKNAFLNHIKVAAEFDNYTFSQSAFTSVYPDTIYRDSVAYMGNLDDIPEQEGDGGSDNQNGAYDSSSGHTCSAISTSSYLFPDIDSSDYIYRLKAYCSSDATQGSDSIKFRTNIVYSTDGMSYSTSTLDFPNGSLAKESVCGPHGDNDYYFTIYGSCNYESDTAPQQCTLSIETMTRLGDMNYMGYDNYTTEVKRKIDLS